ncbi:hypothetical protein, partial [Collimonas pratensis]|uniref:hypothetical protein n=1 Tax=Collimonas pratensis TaxID=279113 RepID=UPI00197DFA70
IYSAKGNSRRVCRALYYQQCRVKMTWISAPLMDSAFLHGLGQKQTMSSLPQLDRASQRMD